ncbi:MAG: endospore germination permease, partial [Peptococcaceae bacterium]|nr:endospore germination permease [Peptococcaceae bacterium]
WLAPLGGLAVALTGVYVLSLVLKKRPGSTIIEITEQACGPVIGIALNLVTVVFFMFVCSLFIREFSEALIIAALPSTPLSVISSSYLIVGLLGAHLGIEALARTARLTYIYIMGGMAVLLLALIPQWNINDLFPLLGMGPLNVFGLGTYSTAAVTEIIFAAVIVQTFGGAENFGRIGSRSMLIGFIFLMALMATTVMTLGRNASSEATLPFYNLSRDIYLGRFFQRVEALFVIIWSIVGGLKIAMTLYGASVALARTLKLPDYRPLIWPLGLAVFVTSLLPPDLPLAIKLDMEFLRPLALLPNYLIPPLILAAWWYKGRGKRAGG